jgi:hypothetical protein
MNTRIIAGGLLIATSLSEVVSIVLRDCSLLSLDIHPDYVCGENAGWFAIPAICFLTLGLYILMKKPWYEELGLSIEPNHELLFLKKENKNLSLTIIEKEKEIEVIINAKDITTGNKIRKALLSLDPSYSVISNSNSIIHLQFSKINTIESKIKNLLRQID